MQVYVEHLFDEHCASFHHDSRIQRHADKDDGGDEHLYGTRIIVQSQ